MTGLPEARYREWRPGRLADWEIRQELGDPETAPERREALEGELEERRRERATAGRRGALEAAEAGAAALAVLGVAPGGPR
jgi:hypothetical protein